jgi:hypothetical protein
VRVDFPKGTLTEWYPHAGRTDTKLTWDDNRGLALTGGAK